MPGRQSTGPAPVKRFKSKKQKKERSLNALAIAEKEIPPRLRIGQHRLGEVDQASTKRRRDEPEDESEEEGGRHKRSKRSRIGEKDKYGNEIEGGSDSEGGEWMTGQVDSANDSDLDSDEAMGESDEERFEGYTFRGSSSIKSSRKKRMSTSGADHEQDPGTLIDLNEGDQEGEDLEDESEGFAEDAVDLARMLDASDGEDTENARIGKQDRRDMADEDNGSVNGISSEEESVLSMSETDDGTNNARKLSALQTFVTTLSNGDTKATRRSYDDAQEAATPSEYGLSAKQKLTISDLLPTITDPQLKKSLKLMANDGKKSTGKTSGIPQKLEVPLAKRQQDRLDRAAAYEKSKETLGRWIETVKHNRRVEHLSFPLQDPDAISAKDTSRLQLDANSKPITDLESTIQKILVESGLVPADGKSQETQIQAFEELAMNKMPLEEVQARRAELRKARELLFREEIRAKRIKKIKSKSYRRIHRRERERNLLREKQAFEGTGVEPSDEEQERIDRRRAEERMGARHREGRWARGVKDSGRTAWDEDARSGVVEMARRGEELRKRIEGKDIRNGEDDPLETSSDSSEDEDDTADNDGRKMKQRFQDKLQSLGDEGGVTGPGSGLASMKFMQNAEAARKKQNDEDIERMRREFAGEDSPDESDSVEESGRRSYGPQKEKPAPAKRPLTAKSEFEERPASDEEDNVDAAGPVEDEDTEIIINSSQSSTKASKQNLQNPFRQTSISKSTPSSSNQPTTPSSKDTIMPGPFDPNAVLATLKKTPNRKPRPHEEKILISTNLAHIPPSSTKPTTIVSSLKPPRTSKPSKVTPKLNTTVQINNDTLSDSDSSFTGFSPTTPPPLTNTDLIHRAFAGDDVFTTFRAEKAAAVAAEDEQVVETTLPGWGAWTGEGLTKREKKSSAKRKTFEKVEGVKPEKRADRGLERVVVAEGRGRKVRLFLLTSWCFLVGRGEEGREDVLIRALWDRIKNT